MACFFVLKAHFFFFFGFFGDDTKPRRFPPFSSFFSLSSFFFSIALSLFLSSFSFSSFDTFRHKRTRLLDVVSLFLALSLPFASRARGIQDRRHALSFEARGRKREVSLSVKGRRRRRQRSVADVPFFFMLHPSSAGLPSVSECVFTLERLSVRSLSCHEREKDSAVCVHRARKRMTLQKKRLGMLTNKKPTKKKHIPLLQHLRRRPRVSLRAGRF